MSEKTLNEKPYSVKLNMTIEEMENEIITMRRLEKYIIDNLGMEQYDFLVKGFAREIGREKLKELGASDEEIEMISENIDIETGYGTEKQ